MKSNKGDIGIDLNGNNFIGIHFKFHQNLRVNDFSFYPEDPFSKTPPTSLQISQIMMQIIASMFYSVESSMP